MKKLIMLLAFLFIVAMVAGCVESSTPEATPTVTPMLTPTVTSTSTPTSISKVTLTPEQVEELRRKWTESIADNDIKDECPYCTHDWDNWIIILEIDGELWWVCTGHFDKFQPEDQRCTYMRKATEKEILRYLD